MAVFKKKPGRLNLLFYRNKRIVRILQTYRQHFSESYPRFRVMDETDDCVYLQLSRTISWKTNGFWATVDEEKADQVIRKYIQSVFAHVGINPSGFILFVRIKQCNGYFALAKCDVKRLGSPNEFYRMLNCENIDQWLTIVTRECIRQVLYVKGISFETEEETEVAIDVGMVFFGFRGLAEMGLLPYRIVIPDPKDPKNPERYRYVKEYQLGKISMKDVFYTEALCDKMIRKTVCHCRKKPDQTK